MTKQKTQISTEHITNNEAVRNTLLSLGIVPENVKPQEDIKKVEIKLNSETRKILRIGGEFENLSYKIHLK